MASITLNEVNLIDAEAVVQEILDRANAVLMTLQTGDFELSDVLDDLDAIDGAELDLRDTLNDIANGDLDNDPDED